MTQMFLVTLSRHWVEHRITPLFGITHRITPPLSQTGHGRSWSSFSKKPVTPGGSTNPYCPLWNKAHGDSLSSTGVLWMPTAVCTVREGSAALQNQFMCFFQRGQPEQKWLRCPGSTLGLGNLSWLLAEGTHVSGVRLKNCPADQCSSNAWDGFLCDTANASGVPITQSVEYNPLGWSRVPQG